MTNEQSFPKQNMVLVSLCGVRIMFDYLDKVWFREMM
jgi:hypothetical protein